MIQSFVWPVLIALVGAIMLLVAVRFRYVATLPLAWLGGIAWAIAAGYSAVLFVNSGWNSWWADPNGIYAIQWRGLIWFGGAGVAGVIGFLFSLVFFKGLEEDEPAPTSPAAAVAAQPAQAAQPAAPPAAPPTAAYTDRP